MSLIRLPFYVWWLHRNVILFLDKLSSFSLGDPCCGRVRFPRVDARFEYFVPISAEKNRYGF